MSPVFVSCYALGAALAWEVEEEARQYVAFATQEETMFGLRADRLSIYNGLEYCWVHDPVRFPRVRGKSMARQAA